MPQREPRQSRRTQQDRPPAERKSGTTFPSRTLPDSYQIFVGGLPTGTTDQELRDVFSGYGNILEVRTNPKNFGFIVFDNEDSVRDIMLRKETDQFQIRRKNLNIEEKKPSEKRGLGGGGGGGASGGLSGGNRRQPSTAGGPGNTSSNRGNKGGKPVPRRS